MPAQSAPKDFTPIDGDDELICDGSAITPERLAGFFRKMAERPIYLVPDQILGAISKQSSHSER